MNDLISVPVCEPLKHAEILNDKMKTTKKCFCGGRVQWKWDNGFTSDYVEILNNDMEVRFNRKRSNGTAVARCTEPMTDNQYYWEVKMTYPVYGTDIMIGVGTPEARTTYLQNRFVSRLGMDGQTWGFSYTGLFHHNGERKCYAQKFDKGNTIGVHLDLWKGTLSFYKDRKNLGIASYGLKGKTLYAMACSTAARSGMRIVRSCSFPSSLQFLCAEKLRELIPEDKNVLDVIEIPPGLKQYLQNNLSWLLDKRDLDDDSDSCCIADDESDGEIVNESTSHNNDPFGLEGQFVLIGSLMCSFNQFVQRRSRAIRNRNSEEREESSDRDSKRRCISYLYTCDLPDYDSD